METYLKSWFYLWWVNRFVSCTSWFDHPVASVTVAVTARIMMCVLKRSPFMYLKRSISSPLCVKGFIQHASWQLFSVCVCGHSQPPCVTLPGLLLQRVAMSQIGPADANGPVCGRHAQPARYTVTHNKRRTDSAGSYETVTHVTQRQRPRGSSRGRRSCCGSAACSGSSCGSLAVVCVLVVRSRA